VTTDLKRELETTAARIAEIEQMLRTKNAERKAEIAAAEKEINARYDAMPMIVDGRNEAHALYMKKSDLTDAIARVEAEADPDVGRRVVRYTSGPYSWNKPTTRHIGIVEIRTRDSKMPANRSSWGHPQIGEKMIRILKTDGKPGLMVERFQLLADVEKNNIWRTTPYSAEEAKRYWQFEGEERK